MSQHTPVSSVMKRTTVAVALSTTLREAAEVMAREEVGALVVRGQDEPAGIISERDIVRAVADGTDLDEERVSERMAYDVVWAGPHDDVATAATTMVEGGIRHLPVLEDGTVVGILSVRDLVPHLLD